jgi:hypothetical protein
MTTTRTMMSQTDADRYAEQWMSAWNAHDVERIASHYRDDVEYHSPFVARFVPDGRIQGRAALRDYFTSAFERYPDLHFGSPIAVGAGAGSISMMYHSVEDLLAIETLVFDEIGLVTHAYCHYRSSVRRARPSA